MRSYSKKIFMFLAILLLCMSLIGCMHEQDLTHRAIIVGVGIDKAEDEEIELTLQIVNPSGLGLQQGGGRNIQPIWVNSTKGKTVYEAAREQLKAVNRRPFYSHIQVLVISEELAKEGIMDILDYFSRDYEVRLNSSVIIARGTTAKKVISAKSTLEDIPAIHLKEVLEDNLYSGVIRNINTFEMVKELNENILNTTIGVVKFKEGEEQELIKSMELEGTAIFKEDKLVGWLEKYETAGLLYIKNEIRDRVIGIKDPLNENKRVVIEQLRSNGKVRAKIENEKLKIHINIKAEGTIGEQQGENDLLMEKILKDLEREVANTIKEDIKKTVDIAQNQFQSDILGFGEEIRKKHLNYWREIEDNWDEIFPEVPVEIDVEFRITRSGLTGPPSKAR
ncbi:Ger(x)C family spore germination protein [Alkaliphilus sp. MSJ-5]|uniref:Ger(X)C family spore germination protein n=1 Tax=Alkaliphilus flagellatus TaxID=2841507 RepID=A0ABS6G437_9FIRM|nr:Ger(x)C family spore germination protein [Alkaliphilus flagellatus]MBU5677256.1 Ger(x)C family spore germination protein [Alkaliphilus flagellatus]